MKLPINKKLVALTLILLLLIVPYFYFDSESQELDDGVRSSVAGKFVELADGIVHYELTGAVEEKTVVLIHGFTVPY